MRVGVDGRSLVGGGARGVAQATRALLAALAAGFPDDEWRVLLPRGRTAALPPGVVPVRHPLPSRVLFGAAAVTRRPRLDALLGAPDVLWLPAPAPVATGRTPAVLTVHDRSWELRPGDFTTYERLWHRMARPRALARSAARVVAVTGAVRDDVVTAWRLDPGRVVVAHQAPVAGQGDASADSGVPRPFLLFVGALEPRKAPDVLVTAHAAARARGLRAGLVVVGEGRLAPAVHGPGVHRLGRVGDDRLAALYRDAVALVLPSRLEGFGLPPVEALAHGTPPVVSDLPALREVLGGSGAVYVPPGDPGALATALLRVEREPGLRAAVVGAGRAATRPLRWSATAARVRATLAEAAELGRCTRS